MNVYTSEVEMLRAQCREWEKVCNSHLRLIKKLKKERTWVKLTEEEINKLREKHGVTSDGRGIKEFTKVCDFVRDIEAHGIKENT